MMKDTKPRSLIPVVKRVILEAAKLGLEQAGTSLLGPAWLPLKSAMTPLLERLRKRYPGFSLLEEERPGPEARAVAEQVTHALDTDPDLRELLFEGFSNLKAGQEKILQQIALIGDSLDSVNGSLDHLADRQDRILEILEEKRLTAGRLEEVGPLEEVDPVEYVKRATAGDSSDTARLLRVGVGLGVFIKEVVEVGEEGRTYGRVIEGMEVQATASGRFEDEHGRVCRDLRLSQRVDGTWRTSTSTFYRHRGRWWDASE